MLRLLLWPVTMYANLVGLLLRLMGRAVGFCVGLVLAALEYAPGEPVPRSILALRSPMGLTGDGSAFEGQVFAALYSGRNFTCIVSGNSLPEEDTLWTGTDWIGVDENGEGYALGGEPISDSLVRAGEPEKRLLSHR